MVLVAWWQVRGLDHLLLHDEVPICPFLSKDRGCNSLALRTAEPHSYQTDIPVIGQVNFGA